MSRIEELETKISQLETAFSKLKCVHQMQLSEQNQNIGKLKETVLSLHTHGWSVGVIARELRCSEAEIKRITGQEE